MKMDVVKTKVIYFIGVGNVIAIGDLFLRLENDIYLYFY